MNFQVVNMAEISVTNFSKIKTESRFDAEYYGRVFVEAERVMAGVSSLPLIDFLSDIKTSAFYDAISSFYLEEKGIPFVRVSDIEEPFLNVRKILHLPESVINRQKGLSMVTDEYLLISKGGTTGNICFIPHSIEKVCISRDIIGIKINDRKINRYFLLVFLLTSYGKAQLSRGISRQTLPHLTLNALKSILIPVADKSFQLQIEQMIKQAYEKRILAKQKYQEAENLLYKTLGINKENIETLEEKKFYETKFKRIKQAFGFAAEYYHPKYVGIIEILKMSPFEVKPMKKVIEISREIIDPTKTPHKNKRFKYAPIAKINETGEIYEWTEFYGWQAPSRARMVMRTGDILIPSLAGTFDKIALAPEELDGHLTTTGCFIIRPMENISEFLFLLFKTPLFKRQLEQQTTGAIMSAVPKNLLCNLLIPEVPKENQQPIADLVKEYFKLRREARQLVQRAARDVEENIENVSANRAI